MSGFYEIQHSDGELIQRVFRLASNHMTILRSRGYCIEWIEIDRDIFEHEWLWERIGEDT